MTKRHTARFYENWIWHNGLTLSDMINYIHRFTGKALERYEVIDFLVSEQFSADTLKYMISIQ